MSAVLAPPGWGFSAGYMLAGASATDLPDMPMLRFLDQSARNEAVLTMLRETPGIARSIRPKDLVAKYGLPQSTSSILLSRARG